MEEEDLYLRANEDFETAQVDRGLWLQAMTLAEGDEVKAKCKYLELRVNQLKVTNKKLRNKNRQEKIKFSLKKYIFILMNFVFLMVVFGVATGTAKFVAREFAQYRQDQQRANFRATLTKEIEDLNSQLPITNMIGQSITKVRLKDDVIIYRMDLGEMYDFSSNS